MPKISPARKEARRDQILAGAMRCFARQGFGSTTIDDICAEADLSTGAVYSYFASKAAIIAALAETGRRATGEHIEDARRAASPLEQLRAVLSALTRPDSLMLHQVDVRFWAEAIGDRRLRERYLASQATLVGELTQIVAPIAAAKGVEPRALAQLITAVTAGAMVQRAIEPDTDLQPLLGALIALLQDP